MKPSRAKVALAMIMLAIAGIALPAATHGQRALAADAIAAHRGTGMSPPATRPSQPVVPPPTVPPPQSVVIPPPALPQPKRPYTTHENHPVPPSVFSRSVITTATKAQVKQGAFVVDSAWRLTSGLIVATGHFKTSEMPGIITRAPKGGTWFSELFTDGAPGPAYIKGVKGNWVLIAQGYGYTVFNYRTHQVARSDRYADILK